MRKDWLVPLTGVAFVIVLIVAFAIQGEPKDADEPVQDIVNFYVDNKSEVEVGAAVGTFAALLLVFFGGYLRRVFAAAEGPNGMLSALVLVGAAITAIGAAIDATILIALAEAAEDIDPAAVQALQALWDNDFLPIALGIELFILSSGLSILRTGVLPSWLGWLAIALAVVGLTPLGWIAFPGAGIWVLIVSVMLAVRARGEGQATAPPPPPAAPVA